MSLAFMFASKFNQNLDKWNVKNCENFNCMFALSGFKQDLRSWNIDLEQEDVFGEILRNEMKGLI
ncbi:BspA family leucine-rich repeat surface protein [Campylobacter sp. CCS1377]|uniref:BspA family leucine-rich repeat surface protein n=1 Tax=Campylobacter sp. CCS1377 TaxID=3158229 RepID=A0AAU7EAR4_9BACT